jgi:predicted aspartyl protease
VSPDGTPVVLLTVAGQTWPAVIDTGFNSDLELPNALHGYVNPRFLGPSESILAGGQRIYEDVFRVDFPFDGQTVIAEATFVPGSEILIGTGRLQAYRLEIHFPNRTVRLERVA